jgi:hypothetical protein
MIAEHYEELEREFDSHVIETHQIRRLCLRNRFYFDAEQRECSRDCARYPRRLISISFAEWREARDPRPDERP